jgi:hypothetical protein
MLTFLVVIVSLLALAEMFIIGYLFRVDRELQELKGKVEFPWLHEENNGLFDMITNGNRHAKAKKANVKKQN